MSGFISQAVIMVGGKGTRLRPLTESRPKPLLPVLGRACAEYVITRLVESGVERIILACGYRSEDMLQVIGDGSRFGVSVEFSFEEEPAGTAGAVKLLQDILDDTFIVASGDVLADVNISSMTETHVRSGAAVTMALTSVDNPTEFGIVGLDGNGKVDRFREKPPLEEVFSNLINAGIYILEKKVLDLVPAGTMYDFSKNLFPDLMSRNEVIQGHVLDGYWKDIGRPSDLLEANIEMARMSGAPIPSDAVLEGTELGPGCWIQGPCRLTDCHVSSSVIMEGASVGSSDIQGSMLLPGVRVIGHSSIRDSIIGSRCTIGRGCRIEDSVIGDRQNITDGAVVSGMKVGGVDE